MMGGTDRQTDRQTDGRTLDSFIDPAVTIEHASSVNNPDTETVTRDTNSDLNNLTLSSTRNSNVNNPSPNL